MIKRIFTNKLLLNIAKPQYPGRCCFSSSSDDDSTPSKPKVKLLDALNDKLIDAASNVGKEIHPENKDAAKKVKYSLLQRLTEGEHDAFKDATQSQFQELLADVNQQKIQLTEPAPKPSWSREQRIASQALVSIRREVFAKARQDGHSADEARSIAEQVVSRAEEELDKKREEKYKGIDAERKEKEAAEITQLFNENKFFKLAYNLLEQNLYQDDETFHGEGDDRRPVIRPDPNLKTVFHGEQFEDKVRFFKDVELKPKPLPFWREWDEEKAKITNKSMGPTNAFEEQIEWTEKGAMWPYPINNEYLIGSEEKVGFYDHVFLEPYVAKYGLPKTGPIAHFMELVCVGLSKNPYMTIEKKREHLDWFAHYFSKQQIEKVHRLHEIEQKAAATA
jgi:hypothetical protein